MVTSTSTVVCFSVSNKRFDLFRGTARIQYFRSSVLLRRKVGGRVVCSGAEGDKATRP